MGLDPGSYFWAALTFGSGCALLALFAAVTGADIGFGDFALTVLGAASAAGWATAAYLRLPVQVGAEAEGIWLRRNGRVTRSIPWSEMTAVRYGGVSVSARPASNRKFLPHTKYIEVRGKRRRQRVWAGEAGFRTREGSLAGIVEWVLLEAEGRGIEVQSVLVE